MNLLAATHYQVNTEARGSRMVVGVNDRHRLYVAGDVYMG